jgi:hypothetical protein
MFRINTTARKRLPVIVERHLLYSTKACRDVKPTKALLSTTVLSRQHKFIPSLYIHSLKRFYNGKLFVWFLLTF